MTVNHTTLGEIVKGHYFPMIEYRTNQMNMSIEEYRDLLKAPDAFTSTDIIYAGLCGYEELSGAGRLISHDGDTYHLSDQIEAYHVDGGDLIVWRYSIWSRP